MSQLIEQKVHKRNIVGHYISKNMFNNLIHQGDTNLTLLCHSTLSHPEWLSSGKRINTNKYWWENGRRTLIHCWWKCELLQPLKKSVWKFLKIIRTKVLHDQFLDVYLTEILLGKPQGESHIPMYCYATILNKCNQ